MLRAASFLALSALCACGAAKPAPEAAGVLHTPARLYPLGTGFVWTYDVDTGTGVPTLAITRVTGAEGRRFQVSSGGAPLLYELRPQGIYKPTRGGWLLKAPVRAGARWSAGRDTTAEVISVDKTVSTPAGNFERCVEVEERGGASGKRVRTVYCPDVGPVVVESSVAMELSGQTVRVRGTLRGYQLARRAP